ncbi:MAG: hypothetical protein M0041_05655 [Nitrospiraceae bacterium]|nr:hypothetical protein [Nitrospiraceae bacterium]
MDKISRHDRFSGGLDRSPGEIPCSGPEASATRGAPDAWPARPPPPAGDGRGRAIRP